MVWWPPGGVVWIELRLLLAPPRAFDSDGRSDPFPNAPAAPGQRYPPNSQPVNGDHCWRIRRHFSWSPSHFCDRPARATIDPVLRPSQEHPWVTKHPVVDPRAGIARRSITHTRERDLAFVLYSVDRRYACGWVTRIGIISTFESASINKRFLSRYVGPFRSGLKRYNIYSVSASSENVIQEQTPVNSAEMLVSCDTDAPCVCDLAMRTSTGLPERSRWPSWWLFSLISIHKMT